MGGKVSELNHTKPKWWRGKKKKAQASQKAIFFLPLSWKSATKDQREGAEQGLEAPVVTMVYNGLTAIDECVLGTCQLLGALVHP